MFECSSSSSCASTALYMSIFVPVGSGGVRCGSVGSGGVFSQTGSLIQAKSVFEADPIYT